jgi:hypothetical protein
VTNTFPPPTPTFTPLPPTPTNTPTPTTIPEAVVQLVFLEYDPPGDDVDGEFVAMENIGGTAADMTDWVLWDDDSNSFIFPSFTLQPGASVRVWTKAGTNTSTQLYWGSAVEIWDNTGDTANLWDNDGLFVDMCSYPGGGQNTAC